MLPSYPLISLSLCSFLHKLVDILDAHFLVDLFQDFVTLLEAMHDTLLYLRELDRRHLNGGWKTDSTVMSDCAEV